MALKLGLRTVLKTIKEARFTYYKLMGLPLLPPENFLDGYDSIKRHTGTTNFRGQFQPLFDYYESFWLAQVIISLFDSYFFVYLSSNMIKM